jgi:hypothetical protein
MLKGYLYVCVFNYPIFKLKTKEVIISLFLYYLISLLKTLWHRGGINTGNASGQNK